MFLNIFKGGLLRVYVLYVPRAQNRSNTNYVLTYDIMLRYSPVELPGPVWQRVRNSDELTRPGGESI